LTDPLTPQAVEHWGRHAGGSPLYAHLAGVIASDGELMRVLNDIEHPPQPNVLFAGVQYLLMKDPDQELASFYPNLTDRSAPVEATGTPFREFVLANEPELLEIGRTRYTQTNESRRCTALLPAIWETRVTEFHLVDIGTSAGLTLLMDRYRYRWDGLEWGPISPVTLECRLRGRAPLPQPLELLSRTGLDLHPLDLADPDDRIWLEALIWPEQVDRRRRIQDTIDLHRDIDMELVAGNASESLGPTLAGLPGDDPIVVMHSFALNQFTPDQRAAVDDALARVRRSRTAWRVSLELVELSDEAPELAIDDGSGPKVVGQAHPHGEWLDLYARP
jgi:hypothetical protein